MKTFKEYLDEAKEPSKDVAFLPKKMPETNTSRKFKKGDYLQYSHMGVDQALMKQTPMFSLMGKQGDVYVPTGVVFSIPMKDVKDSGKKFVKVPGPMNKYEVK